MSADASGGGGAQPSGGSAGSAPPPKESAPPPSPVDGAGSGSGSNQSRADGGGTEDQGGGGGSARPSNKTLGAGAGKAAVPGLGEASTDHQRLREAEVGFGGDQVHGGKTVNNYGAGAATRVPPRRLSDARMDPVRHTFVEPEGWGEFRARTQRHQVLMLRAAEGAGRWTMAVRLLHSRGLQELYELTVADHLDRLPEVVGAGGYVLVLDRDATLTAQMLSSCVDRLGSDGCLVITCDRSVTLGGELQDFVVDAPAAPGPMAILESHLRWRIGEVNADRVLSRQEVSEFLAGTIRSTTTRRDVAALATLMAEESAGDTVDLDAVARRYTQRGDDELDTWFEGLPDLGMRTFAIALAVLHGLPYEDVAHAARLLQRRLEREGAPLESAGAGAAFGPLWQDPFATPNRARLARLRAMSYRTVPEVPDEAPPATRVAYRDMEMRPGALDRAWNGYQIQVALLLWLVDLVERPSSPDVPFRAAAALGHLATRSFRFVQRRVLWLWSGSDEERHRDVVAWAMRASANDPLLRPSVERFVEELSAGDDWQQATAAGVIGISLGPADPEAAFRKFDEYATFTSPTRSAAAS
jgi:hypothetical protein